MRWKWYPILMITQRDKCRVRAREYEQLARFCSDRDTELLYRKLANEWRELATLIDCDRVSRTFAWTDIGISIHQRIKSHARA